MCCCSTSLVFWAAIDGVHAPEANRPITQGRTSGIVCNLYDTHVHMLAPLCICWPHASSLVVPPKAPSDHALALPVRQAWTPGT